MQRTRYKMPAKKAAGRTLKELRRNEKTHIKQWVVNRNCWSIDGHNNVYKPSHCVLNAISTNNVIWAAHTPDHKYQSIQQRKTEQARTHTPPKRRNWGRCAIWFWVISFCDATIERTILMTLARENNWRKPVKRNRNDLEMVRQRFCRIQWTWPTLTK